jgi:hypothetical protein
LRQLDVIFPIEMGMDLVFLWPKISLPEASRQGAITFG